MPLPRSLYQTYIDGSPPAPDAELFNSIQRSIIDKQWESVLIRDHFTGDQLNRGQWNIPSLNGSGSNAFVDDAAGKGFGVYKFTCNGLGTVTLQASQVATGVGFDFRMRARVRITKTTAQFGGHLGFGGLYDFRLDSTASATDWRVGYNNIVKTPNVVAVNAINSTYKLFEIELIGDVSRWYIDTVLVHQENVLPLGITAPSIQLVNNAAGDVIEMWNDSFELYTSSL